MSERVDAVELAIFQSMVHSIAEEMGAALRRTALSPNIKERRDYSCAVFDGEARVIAMGDHMPVHLGSMPMSVEAAVKAIAFGPGDIAILNDPYAGGTHLPDITMVLPVYRAGGASGPSGAKAPSSDESLAYGLKPVPFKAGQFSTGDEVVHGRPKPEFYVAARAHHADVGGMYAGSMGPAREIYQEGIRIPPVRIVRGGEVNREVLELLLYNVRTPKEREGDLDAQMGACRVGEQRMLELMQRFDAAKLRLLGERLLDYSEACVRAELRGMPEGEYSAEDWLDSDGVTEEPRRICVRLRFEKESVTADFTGSSAQVAGSVNAVRAITLSACFYVLRCLLAEDAPATAGILRPLTLITEEGSLVDARPPAAVAGANVETSQRIVDVLLRALAKAVPERVPAASAGTMSNLSVGGFYPEGDARAGEPFTYYETAAGGMGARRGLDGIAGVQTHMTNSLNTPVEALEYAYPFRAVRYAYRQGSGGVGQWRGGDGLVREVEMLADAEVTLLAERRVFRPYGLQGGGEGAAGRAVLIVDEVERELPGKCSQRVAKGTRVRLETPGGGGWGKVEME